MYEDEEEEEEESADGGAVCFYDLSISPALLLHQGKMEISCKIPYQASGNFA